MDSLCPTLAEERAKREAELAKARAERLANQASVMRAIESVCDSWEDAGLTPNVELVRKACQRKLERDEATFARAFAVELIYNNISNADEQVSLLNELGLNVKQDGLPPIDDNGDLLTEEEATEEINEDSEEVTPEVNVD